MADFGCNMFSEGFDVFTPPLLKDIDFWFWKARMKSFIKSSNYHMWGVLTNDFDFKTKKDLTEKEKKLFSLNIRAMQILYKGVTENDFQKIRFCSNAKEIWDTLDSLYASNYSVEAENVESSSDIPSFISTSDEQMEVEIEEDKLTRHFHDSVNTTRDQEKGDPLRDQDTLMVNIFHSPDSHRKFDLHENDFQSTILHISNIENVFNHAGKYLEKKDHFCKNENLYSLGQHNNDRKSHTAHHSIICHYCGKSGHISHICHIRRNSNVRNKFIWVPKGQVRSNANHVGPKYKWVPKDTSRTLLVQENSKASHDSRKRARDESTAATSWSNHKRQCSSTRRVYSSSRESNHRVSYNYLEKNKRNRIPKSTRRKLLNSISLEKAPQPKDMYRRTLWVIRREHPST